MAGSIVFVGVAPHPPLLVPEVGGSRIARVRDSQRALTDFSRRLVESNPETVVLISPHSPLDANAFTARATRKLKGDFAEFYAPGVRLEFANDLELLAELERQCAEAGLKMHTLEGEHDLDHGALVPLYYLRDAGWAGTIVVLGFSFQSIEIHVAFGEAIRQAAARLNRRIAVVASGDLSHRLIVGGPYEFEPTAHVFDEQVVSAITRGDARGVLEVDPGLRTRAGECGYRSIVVAIGAAGSSLRDHQVLSYEGPFGVGYMVAVLYDANQSS
ncbi:MAG TPA: AmmeMemoRadiSam system protein B [Blastocatellia bacterium]|nr:AmmeMemoRadiSam system protein B [Blastocatellia bacterium]